MKKHYFVYACSFFFSLAGNFLNFSLVYRLKDQFLFNTGQIGAFIAIGSFFYFIGCNLYHRFGSAFEPIKIFPLAALVALAASFPLGHANARGLVYAAYWVIQVSTGFYWPPVMAWLTAGLNQKELNREISFFNRSWMGANILGPLVAGTLYHWNSQINFFLINICYSIVILFLWLLRRYSLKHGESLSKTEYSPVASADVSPVEVTAQAPLNVSRESPRKPGPNTYRPQLKNLDKKLDLYRYKGWISAFSSTLFLGILINILPIHIRDGLGFTERSAGLILFMRSAAGFLGFAVLARFTSWHFNRRWFYILQAGLIASTLLCLAAGNRIFLFFGTGVLVGLCYAGCYNNSIFYSGITGKNPKKNLALHEIFLSVGTAIGTAGGGFFYDRAGFTGTCFILILALVLGGGVQFILDRRVIKYQHAKSTSL